jgi:ribosomal protein S18 acetylase RimI-like enzyme
MRAPNDEDAPLVAELTSRYAPDPYPVAAVLHDWMSPGFDKDVDARVDNGAYAAVLRDGADRAYIDVCGDPSEDLVDWAIDHARERGFVRVFTSAWSDDAELHAAFARAGFRLVRHSYRMAIALDDDLPEPAWPEGITVRTAREEDVPTVYAVQQETFEDHWEHEQTPFEEWTHALVGREFFRPELWFIAEAGGEVAGVALCNQRESNTDAARIAIIGVRRPWRRRGLGRALLVHAFRELRRAGFRRATLGVDAESLTGAHRLYESAGMHVIGQHDIFEKRL